MRTEAGLLAVIPARGGSKDLPGKNVKLFAGLPLIAHSILFAKACAQIDRVIVSTEASEVVEVARRYGADVPFLRPPHLARDETPLWLVLRHTLDQVEQEEHGMSYQLLLLLDPTSPARLPEDLVGALDRLSQDPLADGIIAVSRPNFNPIWHCVVEREVRIVDLFDEGSRFQRRQDVPVVYHINGSLYLWRTEFVRRTPGDWRRAGRHLIYEIPELRAISIDDLQGFEKAEALVKQGLISFPWLDATAIASCAQSANS